MTTSNHRPYTYPEGKFEATYPPVIELMSFCQGADFVLRNRLNKWQYDQG
jgi:hypothetical protein